MNETIHILHLEDNPMDSEMLQDKLESAGLECAIQRVDNRRDFASAVEKSEFDLILCDFNLPDYDGISALQLARVKQPLTPVMLVSGSLKEEEAVQCLHYGANDYLLKGNLERLPSAVQNALKLKDERRRLHLAQVALKESEARFRQLAEHSSEGFWFVEVEPLRFLYASPPMAKIWGLPTDWFVKDPRTLIETLHPEDRLRVRESWLACLREEVERYEADYRVVRAGGAIRWVQDSGNPIRDESGRIVRMSGVVRDVTDRKLIESQMLRTQRLESIGTLASGVAHDLNNALAPIMMASELLKMEYPNTASRYLDIIQTGAKRGADMVRQLLTFARGSEGERVLVQTKHLLREMERLILGTFPKNIRLSSKTDKDLGVVMGDATQLHQVLLNLCVNARDAMPDGGTLTLKAENKVIDSLYARILPEAKPGRFVVCTVEDTGTGIPPEVIDRIFEPFFSTKGPEKGTGLGLSTVIGIVRGHGGFLRVYSVPGKGSIFAVYLPAVEGEGGASGVEEVKTEFRGQGELILVVDDEPAVRQVTRGVLTGLNFKVLTASDGTEALLILAQKHAELAAVITDLHMPGVDGLAFVRVLRAKAPNAGIIVASGRLDEAEQAAFKELGARVLLEKPFTQEALVNALKAVFTP